MKRTEIDATFVSKVVPARMRSSHKRDNGTVCVVGGSRLYHGAPFLAGMGALRTGVDIVYLAVPATIAPTVRALSPDFIVVPLPDAKLTRGNVNKLQAWVKGVNCYAVGPGLGQQNPEEVAHALNEFKGDGRSLVVDADALRPQILPAIRGTKTIVTPHSGEFERLFGLAPPAGIEERTEFVMAKAREAGVTVLLKGPTDVISDGESVGLNNTHSPGMTVGGTGDVLTGVSAGLLSKGVDPFEAACAAAFINGAAGEAAVASLGLHTAASDVANNIANAMKRFDKIA